MKLNYKLILAFGVLIIGLVLMALGNISKYFILVACVFLALSCLLFLWEQRTSLQTSLRSAEETYADDNATDVDKAYVELRTKELTKTSKRLMVSLIVAAVLLIVVGIVAVV